MNLLQSATTSELLEELAVRSINMVVALIPRVAAAEDEGSVSFRTHGDIVQCGGLVQILVAAQEMRVRDWMGA